MKNSFELNESRIIRWHKSSDADALSGNQKGCASKTAAPYDLADTIGGYDSDELLLLPNQVLEMDSLSFCKDVASVAPCFISNNYCDVKIRDSSAFSFSDSNKLLQDSHSGLILTKASNGCLWLCKCLPLNA
jgi:hypothetical protein